MVGQQGLIQADIGVRTAERVSALLIAAGVDMVRVHNVPLYAQASRMTDALVRSDVPGSDSCVGKEE